MGVSRVKYAQNSSGAVRREARRRHTAVDSPTPDDDDESRLTDRRTKRSPRRLESRSSPARRHSGRGDSRGGRGALDFPSQTRGAPIARATPERRRTSTEPSFREFEPRGRRRRRETAARADARVPCAWTGRRTAALSLSRTGNHRGPGTGDRGPAEAGTRRVLGREDDRDGRLGACVRRSLSRRARRARPSRR